MPGAYLRGGRVNKKKQARFLAKTWASKMRSLNLAGPARPALRGRVFTKRYPTSLATKPAGRFTALNGNMTNSKCTHLSIYPRRNVRLQNALSVSTILSDQYPIRVDGTYGFQAISSFGFFRQQDIAKLPQYPVPVPGVGGNLPYRILLQSVTGNLTMANACSAPVELEIFDIVLKRDLPLALQWTQHGNSWTVPETYPDAMWAQGSYANNATINTGGSAFSANIAASPFDSTLFNAYFKVKKRTKVLLGQGGVHRHSVVSRVNKLLDSVMFNQNANQSMTIPTSGVLGWKGVTTFCMVIQKGLPVSSAETASIVTSAETHVDIIQDFRLKWNYVVDNSFGVQNNDSLQTPAVGQIINPGSGTATNIVATV